MTTVKALRASAVPDLKSTTFDTIVEFRSAFFYGEESEGKVTVEVVRLGPSDTEASVQFSTVDGSACAGRKYHHSEGELRFARGEKLKRIPIDLIGNEAYDATLEFEVTLSDPSACVLGGYLHTCRVIIVDDDTFPSNRFAVDLRAMRFQSIPPWSLMLDFVHMNLKVTGIRHAAIKNMLVDQMMNLRFVYNVLLMNFLIDGILLRDQRAEDGNFFEEKLYHFFTRNFDRVVAVVCLSLLPHFFMVWFTRGQVKRRIKGQAVHMLQGNLFRKYFNYNDSSRNVVSTSELVMALTRDIPELVQSGFLSFINLVRELGLLVILMATIFVKRGAMQAWLIGIFFVSFVVLMVGFLLLRQPGIERRQGAIASSQTILVRYIQHAAATFRLVADYGQQPAAVAGLETKVVNTNAASTAALLYDATSREFAAFLTTTFIGLYVVCQFQNVLDGAPFGDFMAGIAMWRAIGNCFENLYRHLLSIMESMEQNHRIVTFMNLPIEVPQRMQMHGKLLCEAEEEWKLAQKSLDQGTQEQGPRKGYALDTLSFKIRNLTFQYPEHTGGSEILNNVTFSFPMGKMVAVTGPRSGGKATLLGLLGGVLFPSQFTGKDSLSFFIPPHLRVLHVSRQPLFLDDLTLFENLCYGPSGGNDENAHRVLAICKRLGVSQSVIDKIAAEVPQDQCDTDFIQTYSSHQAISLDILKAKYVLSHTDQALLHIARAFVMNPEVLVIHKPLSNFDDLHARLVVELMREFVDLRGIEKPGAEYYRRRPRTCIFSEDTTKEQSKVDLTFFCGQGQVKLLPKLELQTLRVAAHKAFQAMDVDNTKRVKYDGFASAIQEAPWIAELVGITAEQLDGPNEQRDAAIREVFRKVDYSTDGNVDYEELVEFMRGQMDDNLPSVLAGLKHSMATPRTPRSAKDLLVVPNELPMPGARSSDSGLKEAMILREMRDYNGDGRNSQFHGKQLGHVPVPPSSPPCIFDISALEDRANARYEGSMKVLS